MKFLIMNKNINRLIKAKRVSVKMGRLYCIVDDNGRKHYALEQIPVIKSNSSFLVCCYFIILLGAKPNNLTLFILV